jgi:hypothetical protein
MAHGMAPTVSYGGSATVVGSAARARGTAMRRTRPRARNGRVPRLPVVSTHAAPAEAVDDGTSTGTAELLGLLSYEDLLKQQVAPPSHTPSTSPALAFPDAPHRLAGGNKRPSVTG